VRAALQQGLGEGVQLQQRHVWLLQPPAQHVQLGPWLVVAMAALEAMEHGRRALWRQHHHGHGSGGLRPVEEGGRVVQAAAAAAARQFWLLLLDFAGDQRAPVGRDPSQRWRGWGEVGAGHPLLAVQGEGAAAVVVARVPAQP
jgi:hypothetical protein